jgi:MFS family permease
VAKALNFLRGNVLVLTVCSILWRISVDVVSPYLALYIMALGGRYETIGLVIAVGNLAGMLLYPLGGYIADYQGRIKVMAYMTYVYSLTFLIFVFTESWEWVAVGMFSQSLVTFYTPAMQALMADSLPPGRRGLGFAATFAIPSAFGIASPLIGGWLIAVYGITPAIKGLYFFGFLIAILVATLRLRFLRETIPNARIPSIRLGSIPGLALESYRDVARMIRGAPRRLLVLSLLMAGSTFFVSLVMPFWRVRATEVIGINPEQWGTIMLVSGAFNVLLSLPAGSYVDRHNRKTIAGVCLIAGSLPVFLFIYATTFEHVVALSVAATMTNMFLNPALQSMFADMVPREKRGRMISALGGGGIWIMGGVWATGVVAMASITLGSLASGYVYSLGSSLPWVILAGALIVLGLLFLRMVEDPEVGED